MVASEQPTEPCYQALLPSLTSLFPDREGTRRLCPCASRWGCGVCDVAPSTPQSWLLTDTCRHVQCGREAIITQAAMTPGRVGALAPVTDVWVLFTLVHIWKNGVEGGLQVQGMWGHLGAFSQGQHHGPGRGCSAPDWLCLWAPLGLG